MVFKCQKFWAIYILICLSAWNINKEKIHFKLWTKRKLNKYQWCIFKNLELRNLNYKASLWNYQKCIYMTVSNTFMNFIFHNTFFGVFYMFSFMLSHYMPKSLVHKRWRKFFEKTCTHPSNDSLDGVSVKGRLYNTMMTSKPFEV